MKYHVSVMFLMISLLITRHCTGQQENIWVFGNKAGVDFNASVFGSNGEGWDVVAS